MCKCCKSLYDIILYILCCCCYDEEDQYDDFGIDAYINWSNQIINDDLYGAVELNKENNR